MTYLNQNTQQHSYQYLTYLLTVKKHLKDQMLLLSIEAIIAAFILLMSTSLHANNYARNHEVKRGETLWGIARQNNIKVQDILAANGITSNSVIQPGQMLKIPGTQKVQVASTQKVVSNAVTGSQFKTYIVQPKETLYRISKNTGVSQEKIMYVNNLSNANLYVGQKLMIPVVDNQAAVLNNKRNSYRPGFNREVSSQLDMIKIRREKSRFITYKTGINSYDIFENNKYLATVRDNYNSSYTKRRDGVFYNKGSKIDYNYIRSLGYDEATASALSFVSSNEGTASALNFYDGAGSFGFIQFTIKYGSFAEFVSLLKENDYIAYENYLQKYGIVLENNNLVVYAPEGYKGRTRLTGEAIIDYIIKTKSLYGPLIELGENTKAAQVESAREQYMQPILKSQLSLNRLSNSIAVNNVINSTMGVTAVTDLAVKLGVSGATKELERAINIHLANSANPYYSLKTLSNYQLVKLIATTTDNGLVKRRMNKLLKQGSKPLYI